MSKIISFSTQQKTLHLLVEGNLYRKSNKMKAIYNSLFKRSSTFAIVILGSAFFFERTFDLTAEAIFRTANRGKLWEDIKGKYE